MLADVIAGVLMLGGFSGAGAGDVCIAGAWLPLRNGETARHWIGADQSGYIITRADGKRWELGIGGFGTPLGAAGTGLGQRVLTLPGHVVHKVHGVRGPRSISYLLLTTRRSRDGMMEAVVDFHSVFVAGSALTGGAADRSFFHRFVFGGRAKAACGSAASR
jgi:hypothetical protein